MLNPGQWVATAILPVLNAFTHSMHNLIGAIAILTPGNWFLTVFNMMGGFVRTVGAGVSDFWTLISPMQKTDAASVTVFCYFKEVYT